MQNMVLTQLFGGEGPGWTAAKRSGGVSTNVPSVLNLSNLTLVQLLTRFLTEAGSVHNTLSSGRRASQETTSFHSYHFHASTEPIPTSLTPPIPHPPNSQPSP
jgi:hypothetical protein